MAIKSIHLPSLRGNFGSWNYFSTVIKVKDIVENRFVNKKFYDFVKRDDIIKYEFDVKICSFVNESFFKEKKNKNKTIYYIYNIYL